MCEFHRVDLSPDGFKNLRFIPDIIRCYKKYSKFLQDDFVQNDGISYVMRSSPYLWAITEICSGKFMGFVSLDNFAGNGLINYSAEISACFERRAWGNFTKYCAKFFLKKCFDSFGFYKIKAQIYPENHRVKSILKSAGFKYETTLLSETLRYSKPQDIEIYSIYKNYYYKNEEKNHDKHNRIIDSAGLL